jgi:hypothetical protein
VVCFNHSTGSIFDGLGFVTALRLERRILAPWFIPVVIAIDIVSIPPNVGLLVLMQLWHTLHQMVKLQEVYAVDVSVEIHVKGIEIGHGYPLFTGTVSTVGKETLGTAEGALCKSGGPEICLSQYSLPSNARGN